MPKITKAGKNQRAYMVNVAIMALPFTAHAQEPAQVPIVDVTPAVTATSPALTPASPDIVARIKGLQSHNTPTAAFTGDVSTKVALLISKAKGNATPDASQSMAALNPQARIALDQGASLFKTSPLKAAAVTSNKAATPAAENCPSPYDAQAKASVDLLGPAATAMANKDMASLQVQLPKLQALLDSMPLEPIKPEICTDHVNVYTVGQFYEISTLQAHKVPTDVPANLPLVKQPDLPFTSVAYAVGWIKYEQKDYDGAFLAYAKGLIIDPQDQDLAGEYLSTLAQLNRYTDIVGYAENFLTSNNGLSDTERSTFFVWHGVGLLGLGYVDAAEKSLTIALYYNRSSKEIYDLLMQIKDAKAKAASKPG